MFDLEDLTRRDFGRLPGGRDLAPGHCQRPLVRAAPCDLQDHGIAADISFIDRGFGIRKSRGPCLQSLEELVDPLNFSMGGKLLVDGNLNASPDSSSGSNFPRCLAIQIYSCYAAKPGSSGVSLKRRVR